LAHFLAVALLASCSAAPDQFHLSGGLAGHELDGWSPRRGGPGRAFAFAGDSSWIGVGFTWDLHDRDGAAAARHN